MQPQIEYNLELMRRFLIFTALAALILWGLFSFGARADGGWQKLDSGVEVRTISRRVGLSTQTITAVRAPANRVHIVSGSILRASDWVKNRGAIAAINGGYFDDNSKSIGLRVSDGKRTSDFYKKANWGVFSIRDGQASIAHTRDYQGSPNTQQALQCGPRLVVSGKITDLKPQWARRSGIGIQANGDVIIAVSDGAMSFDDWANTWADKNGLNCREALNLDGGPSTQLSVVSSKNSVNVRGGWPVPDAVIVK